MHESRGYPTTGGATVTLRLIVVDRGSHRIEIRIGREERLPHKILCTVVLTVTAPAAGIEPIARAMTTITHELDRLHRQGYTLRQRAGGGLRGAWRTELQPADGGNGGKALVSWESEPRKPTELDQLARVLATVDQFLPLLATYRQKGRTASLLGLYLRALFARMSLNTRLRLSSLLRSLLVLISFTTRATLRSFGGLVRTSLRS